MTDVMLQHVDSLLLERVRLLAKERQCSVNEVLLQALRYGLDISTAQGFSETLHDAETLALPGSHWDAQERGVFQEALRALAQAPATQFAPESIRSDDTRRGAK